MDPWNFPTKKKNRFIPGVGWEYQRCHLVAKKLGGNGGHSNLTTCHGNPTNSPQMRDFENDIYGKVDKGEHILYISVPVYGPYVPGQHDALKGITVVAIGSNGTVEAQSFVNCLKGVSC